jgi:hypothetical protein
LGKYDEWTAATAAAERVAGRQREMYQSDKGRKFTYNFLPDEAAIDSNALVNACSHCSQCLEPRDYEF